MGQCSRLFAVVAVVIFLCSCSKDTGFRKETFPVSGEVYVDGKPAGGLQVTLHDVKGFDKEHPSVSSAFTDDNGKFEVSTYEQADGVPEGEYVATFMWGKMNVFSMQYGGPDQLKNKYLDPKKSEFRVKVEKGKPTDVGRVNLTTQ